MNAFSERLKKAMDEQKVTQSDLASKTGLGKSSISQYLSGKNTPSALRMSMIANALDVSVDWLNGSVIDEWDDTKNREVALAVLEIGQKHIDLTPAVDEYEPCPFCGGEAEYNADSDVVVCTNCCASADKKIWNSRVDD